MKSIIPFVFIMLVSSLFIIDVRSLVYQWTELKREERGMTHQLKRTEAEWMAFQKKLLPVHPSPLKKTEVIHINHLQEDLLELAAMEKVVVHSLSAEYSQKQEPHQVSVKFNGRGAYSSFLKWMHHSLNYPLMTVLDDMELEVLQDGSLSIKGDLTVYPLQKSSSVKESILKNKHPFASDHHPVWILQNAEFSSLPSK